MALYIGADPGKLGALGMVSDGGHADWINIDYDLAPVWKFFLTCSHLKRHVYVAIEMPKPFPKLSKAAILKQCPLHHHAGAIEGMIVAADLKYMRTTSSAWHRSMNVPGVDDLGRSSKVPAQKAAMELFHNTKKKITQRAADAILIAEWCRRKVVQSTGEI